MQRNFFFELLKPLESVSSTFEQGDEVSVLSNQEDTEEEEEEAEAYFHEQPRMVLLYLLYSWT